MAATTVIPKKRMKMSIPPKQRTFSKIPIFIVEYHNDVVEFFLRCVATRHLPIAENTLVHFDSHPDMVIPAHLKAATVFQKEQLLQELSIENWIMPCCFMGVFNKLVWIKNPWCRQIPIGSYQFQIGEYKEKIFVDVPIDYFISEGNYCEETNLTKAKTIGLDVLDSGSALKPENGESKTSETVILDIDLDFFSTHNPFLQIYEKADALTKLEAIYSYEDLSNECASKAEISEKRQRQLNDFEILFLHLDKNRSLEDFRNESISSDKYKKILELVDDIRNSYEDDKIDWLMVHYAGSSCDHDGLPHHESSSEDLEKYYKNFEMFVRQMPTIPKIITISRSSEDNYCPPHQVDDIQSRVIATLQQVFGEKISSKPILAYKNEEWDVMEL